MTSEKIFNTEKLEDASLENVSGGKLPLAVDSDLCTFGLITIPIGALGGPACAIASAVYSSKSHNAMQKGDTKNAEKYAKTAKELTTATAVLTSMVPVGICTCAIGTIDGLKHEEVRRSIHKFI